MGFLKRRVSQLSIKSSLCKECILHEINCLLSNSTHYYKEWTVKHCYYSQVSYFCFCMSIVLFQIEKLWNDLLTCVQSRHCGPYNSDLLTVLSPLLVWLNFMHLHLFLLVLIKRKKTSHVSFDLMLSGFKYLVACFNRKLHLVTLKET